MIAAIDVQFARAVGGVERTVGDRSDQPVNSLFVAPAINAALIVCECAALAEIVLAFSSSKADAELTIGVA